MQTKETTASGKRVIVKTRTVGQHFATDAAVLYRGEVIATTRDYPYGFETQAHDAAVSMLTKL